MITKDLQTLNIRFDQVMFNSLVFTWERNFEVTFGIFSVLVSQINVLESYNNMQYVKIKLMQNETNRWSIFGKDEILVKL